MRAVISVLHFSDARLEKLKAVIGQGSTCSLTDMSQFEIEGTTIT